MLSSQASKYVLSEFAPRAAVVCPAGFAITKIAYKFEVFTPRKGEWQNQQPKGVAHAPSDDMHAFDVVHLNELSVLEMLKYRRHDAKDIADVVRDELDETADSSQLPEVDQNDLMNPNSPRDDRQEKVWAGAHGLFGQCSTLVHCLGHQACLFHYSNKFCQNDPIPGQRKQLDLRIFCSRDAWYNGAMNDIIKKLLNTKLDSDDPVKFSAALLAYPRHTTFIKYESEIDGSRSVLYPPIKYEIPEEEVFNVTCPTADDMYREG